MAIAYQESKRGESSRSSEDFLAKFHVFVVAIRHSHSKTTQHDSDKSTKYLLPAKRLDEDTYAPVLEPQIRSK